MSTQDDDDEEVTMTKKAKKQRKVIDVIYLNDLPTELVIKTLKQKVQEKYLQEKGVIGAGISP